jgi:hypothetical protein
MTLIHIEEFFPPFGGRGAGASTRDPGRDVSY